MMSPPVIGPKSNAAWKPAARSPAPVRPVPPWQRRAMWTPRPIGVSPRGALQRKCACGAGIEAGPCESCAGEKTGFQRKLSLGSSHDPLEREADRIADQVLLMPSPAEATVAPIRVQRFTSSASGPG